GWNGGWGAGWNGGWGTGAALGGVYDSSVVLGGGVVDAGLAGGYQTVVGGAGYVGDANVVLGGSVYDSAALAAS
ncbi:unnamed protein product, partial [Rotaria sp. Silwood1]